MESIITIKDPHFRVGFEPPKSRTDNYIETITNKVTQITEYAVSNGIDYLIITGDLLDKKYKSLYNINSFYQNLELIKKLCKPFKKVFVIPGNHDLPFNNYKNLSDSIYNMIVTHIDNMVDVSFKHYETEDYVISGIPFIQEGTMEQIKKVNEVKTDKIHLCVLHEHFVPIEDDLKELKFTTFYQYEDLPQFTNIDIFIFGHLHKGFPLKYYFKKGTEDKQWYVNTWSLYRLSRNYYSLNDLHTPEFCVIRGRDLHIETLNFKSFEECFIQEEINKELEKNDTIEKAINKFRNLSLYKENEIDLDFVESKVIKDAILKYIDIAKGENK